jgi:hypothetical protein
MTDNSLQKTAETARRSRGPFPKGQSGNPAGRPRGSSNRATRAAEMLLDGEAAALTRKAERAVELALPPIRGDDILAAIKVVSGAVGRGAITPGEGFTLSQMMETFLRAIDASDFENRLRQLEEDQAARREDGEARRYNWAARFDSSPRRD